MLNAEHRCSTWHLASHPPSATRPRLVVLFDVRQSAYMRCPTPTPWVAHFGAREPLQEGGHPGVGHRVLNIAKTEAQALFKFGYSS